MSPKKSCLKRFYSLGSSFAAGSWYVVAGVIHESSKRTSLCASSSGQSRKLIWSRPFCLHQRPTKCEAVRHHLPKAMSRIRTQTVLGLLSRVLPGFLSRKSNTKTRPPHVSNHVQPTSYRHKRSSVLVLPDLRHKVKAKLRKECRAMVPPSRWSTHLCCISLQFKLRLSQPMT